MAWIRVTTGSAQLTSGQGPVMVIPWKTTTKDHVRSLHFWVSNQGPNTCNVRIAAAPDTNFCPDVDSDSRDVPSGTSWGIDRLEDGRYAWSVIVTSTGTSNITFGVDAFLEDR